jgi:hypothetical protein
LVGQIQIQIQTPEIAITFYCRIVDGHTEFPHCMLSFDKSNKRSTQLETALNTSLETRNIRLVNRITSMNEQSKFRGCSGSQKIGARKIARCHFQVPVLKVRSQFRSQLKFLEGAIFFEPKLWMIACTWHVHFHV